VLRERIRLVSVLILMLFGSGACVYQVSVQQGNKLEDKNVAAVEVGMTRNQVRFLLGSPVTADPFHSDRWDYVYYFREGRSDNPDRRWMIVWFNDNFVSKIEKDVPVKPS
jgi:outer membrane protein assembly factor BamE